MMNDPYLILDLPEKADDQAVRAAYLSAVQACPPERDASRFAAIQQAYETLKTRKDRLAYELFDQSLPKPVDLLERACPCEAPGRPDVAMFKALLRGES